MADNKQATLLLDSVRGWNRWRKENPKTRADLTRADLRWADLTRADLRWADLRLVDLRWANLSGANLGEAGLHGANLSRADLSGADLSGAQGLLQSAEWLREHFEITDEGIIAYKVFGIYAAPPEYWDIKPGSKLHEECNMLRTDPCGCGINVATIEWIRAQGKHNGEPIWQVLIPWRENLGSICVPYNTDGKFRCSNIVLLSIYQEEE